MFTALACGAPCSMPVKLGHWQRRTCSAMIGPWSDRPAVSSQRIWPLLAKLELEDLNLILRERRLHWFGHVEHFSGAVKTACDIQIDGRWGAGRPKLTETEGERLPWVKAHDSWHSIKEHLEIRCEICYGCSQPVTWKGAHWCGWYPCTCTLIKNPIMIWCEFKQILWVFVGICHKNWLGAKIILSI